MAHQQGLPSCFARRYGVKLDPPTISLEYEDLDGKRRIRSVKLTKLSRDTDVDRLTRKVIRSFPRRLDAASVKYEQVRKLVFRLLEAVRHKLPAADTGGSRAAGKVSLASLQLDGSTPALQAAISPKLDNPQLARIVKATGDADALRHSSDSRFSTSTVSMADHRSPRTADRDIDGLDELLGELDKELGASHAAGGMQVPSSSSRTTRSPDAGTITSNGGLPAASRRTTHADDAAGTGGHATTGVNGKSRFGQVDDDADSDQSDDQLVLDVDLPEDLNTVTEVELQLAKAKMEEGFSKNRLRPGDPGYEYDKQVAFGPATEPNEWDDDD